MTEVASLMPADHRLTNVRRFEAAPPEGMELVEPGETYATTKEEEWVSKKKTEVVNTKQIETRVKRQVVLEDGKVVEDSGPMVTTNTTEDTETQEHHQTELRRLGDDAVDAPEAIGGEVCVAANPDGVVREVKEKRVVSREETEEVKETEDVQHLGDITDEDFLAAVQTGRQDIREVLRSTKDGRSLVSTGPRLVHESSRTNKVIDTEDKRELSSVLPDGKIVTETQRTTEHEEIRDEELPEDAPERDAHKESSQRCLKTREQEDVDYLADGVKIGHEMRYKTETMEVERHGDDEPDFDSLSARARRRAAGRQPHRYRGLENGDALLDRKDALTKKPLDFDQEEETRKVETSKWLEHHFGSESRSSNSVVDEEEQPPKTSFFNVTIKSAETPPLKYVTTVSTPRAYTPTEPPVEYYKGISQWSERQQSTTYLQPRSPVPDYPVRDAAPTPPLRKRASERRPQAPEPPPDYSPPPANAERKAMQRTRFAPDPPKAKSGNIIGQSIRKLVGKIRSASAERKARQRAKRSPSPSYQKGHVIDNNIRGMESKPVHRYYLGEDPFGGSIYGKENKYDGVRPARSSRKEKEDEGRSQSTLGRFSKSTGRLTQTLPRPLRHDSPKSNSTINVSIINRPLGPAKPARTYKSNLSRSKSFNVHAEDYRRPGMYTSNPHLNRLEESPSGLKSPGLISSLSRSHKDLNEDTTRFAARNGTSDHQRVFVKNYRERTPEYETQVRVHHNKYNGDIYEPPTRLRESQSVLRRGSNSSTDFSETYHTTTRNDDPLRPSVTNTVKSFTKKTVPTKDGRGLETIESSETKSVTKSSYRSDPSVKFYETERRYGGGSPVVIEVRSNNYPRK